jgi:hypothetical protein
MCPRLLTLPTRQSFFLFGPRGVGKTAWMRERFPDAPFFDATLDLQVIDPALKKTFDPSLRQLKDVNTSVVVGGRLYMRF